MILIGSTLLTQEEQKLLREWVNSPGTELYRMYLASDAAAKMAEAANLSVQALKPDDTDLVDARNKFEEAYVMIAANDLIQKLRTRMIEPDLNLQFVALKPKFPPNLTFTP